MFCNKCKSYVGKNHICKEKAMRWFKKLWNSIAKDGYKWRDNPYVFVYEFEKIEGEL